MEETKEEIPQLHVWNQGKCPYFSGDNCVGSDCMFEHTMLRCYSSFSCCLGFYDTQTRKMFGHGSVILYCILIF